MYKTICTTFITFLAAQLFGCLAAFSYEDCIIATDGKLTNIQIQDNTVVDICPLITILNEKNILIVHPLKDGETNVCVLKDDKDILKFSVKIDNAKTTIEHVEGLDVLTLDAPEEPVVIDEPPVLKENGEING